MEWNGMEWNGMEWNGMVSCDCRVFNILIKLGFNFMRGFDALIDCIRKNYIKLKCCDIS
jgi:hypothetical protein